MTDSITESRFYMWRALFAIAHADEVVSNEERSFMNKTLHDYPFSAAQTQILEQDMLVKQDVSALFGKITDPQDRSQFFDYARTLVWCDGDYGEKEQKILLQLKRAHVQSVDFDSLDDTKSLELDDESLDHYKTPRAAFPAAKAGFFARLFGQGKRRWP